MEIVKTWIVFRYNDNKTKEYSQLCLLESGIYVEIVNTESFVTHINKISEKEVKELILQTIMSGNLSLENEGSIWV